VNVHHNNVGATANLTITKGPLLNPVSCQLKLS